MAKEEGKNDVTGLESFDINNMFNTDVIENQLDEPIDLEDFDGLGPNNPINVNNDDDDDDDNDMNFDDNDDDDDNKGNDDADDDDDIDFDNLDDDQKLDFEQFNKKFNTNFKDEAELRAALNKKDDDNSQVTEQEDYDKAVTQIQALTPLLEMDDKELMRRKIEWEYSQAKKNVKDPEIQVDIESDLQEMIDAQLLDVKATLFRNQMQTALTNATSVKNGIDSKRATAKAEAEKAEREELQNHLVNLYNAKNFFGVEVDQKTIKEVYKEITSNDFIEKLTSDKGTIAELALMSKLKEQIFKKASGLTYNDGLKAVLDEFKIKKKKDGINVAQKRGTQGSPDSSLNMIDEIVQ